MERWTVRSGVDVNRSVSSTLGRIQKDTIRLLSEEEGGGSRKPQKDRGKLVSQAYYSSCRSRARAFFIALLLRSLLKYT